MEYTPGDIIKYKDNYGLKKSYYGIVTEQLHSSCISILTESRPERMLNLFLDPTKSTTVSTIEKILTLEEFSLIVAEGYEYCSDREYLLEIAKLREK